MNGKIETTLEKLRIDAFERGIAPEEFTVLLLGAITVLVHRLHFSIRLAGQEEVGAGE